MDSVEGVAFYFHAGCISIVEGIYEGVADEEAGLEDEFAVFEFKVIAGFITYAGHEHCVVFFSVHGCGIAG